MLRSLGDLEGKLSEQSSSSSEPSTQAAPLPPGVGWYQGPFPPRGWASDRESIWRVLLRRGLTAILLLTILFGSMFFFFIALAGVIGALASGTDSSPDRDDLSTEFVAGDEDSDNKLLLVRVSGPILGEDPGGGGFFSLSGAVTYGYSVKEELRKAALDPSIKGVILEMNTPGGTIFGSEAIADGVTAYQESTGNPVLAFVAGISASGGMWGMAPADRILADSGSLVGSIGVIMGPFVYYNGVVATDGGILGGGVTTTNGITADYITAGRSKDVGNPYRPLTTEERASLQAGIDSTYDDFVTHIATNRNISEATIRDQLGAMIFSNEQAQASGLIDGTANRQDAYVEAATLADVRDWQVVRSKDSISPLAGLFADFRGEEPEAAAAPETFSVCLPPNTVMAYYGDLGALCKE